jgi:hypothetical protein
LSLVGVARLGDSASGTCTAHSGSRAWTGHIDTVSSNFDVDGVRAALLNDTGNCSCGHRFRINSASPVLSNNGVAVARNGDQVVMIAGGTGPGGTITSGSSNVVTT